MKKLKWSIAALFAVAASAAWAGEKMTLEQLPPAAQATIKKETRGTPVHDIEKEIDDGKTRYEVEFTRDGLRWELDVTPDGKLLEKKPLD